MDFDTVIKRLKAHADEKSVEGMARVGISPDKAFGVKIPNMRALAKEIKKDPALAGKLWAAGIRETMILATMIDDPSGVSPDRMEAMAADFYDWEVCDQCCMNLFEKTAHAWDKAVEWASRDEEYVKRAGFVLMARLAVSDKKAVDEAFHPFLPLIVREATDGRNIVKKAVNWALRQIGKRNCALNEKAIEFGETISRIDHKAARWIAADALRELKSEAVQNRLITKRN